MAVNIDYQITKTLSDEFLSDVLITAFDGDLGACWYWAQPAQDHWLQTVAVPNTRQRLWLHVAIAERDEPNKGRMVDENVLAQGIRLLLVGKVGIRSDLLEHLKTGVWEGDAGEIDAEVADCIVQAGLFGQIVYG